MIKLACPSCGAELELPEQLNIAHCMYCGNKIILRGDNALNEMVNLKRYTELARVAVQAKNYEDAIKYSNHVLEIDTQNIEAWLMKAVAVFWLSTARDDKYEAAMKYIDTAAGFAPDDPRIMETRTNLAQTYSVWLTNRGIETMNHARQIRNLAANQYADGVLQMMGNRLEGRNESRQPFIEAMQLFLNAANLDVNNLLAFQNIRDCAKEAHWVAWSPEVLEKIQILNNMEAKLIALRNIAGLEKSAAEKRAKLKAIEGKNSFWDKATRADLQDEIKALDQQIRENRSKAAYEPPVGKKSISS